GLDDVRRGRRAGGRAAGPRVRRPRRADPPAGRRRGADAVQQGDGAGRDSLRRRHRARGAARRRPAAAGRGLAGSSQVPDVNMPKLSDTMEEGTVLEWKKGDGEEVHRGEVLAEIESDKASFEIEAEADGVLHIAVEQGLAVPVGQLIGRIGGEAPARA